MNAVRTCYEEPPMSTKAERPRESTAERSYEERGRDERLTTTARSYCHRGRGCNEGLNSDVLQYGDILPVPFLILWYWRYFVELNVGFHCRGRH